MSTIKILEIFFGVFFGAIVAIIITIWVENSRKPRLKLQQSTIRRTKNFEESPDKQPLFLYLELMNKPLPSLMKWMSRQAAMQCYGTIVFRNRRRGENIFDRADKSDREMTVRWPDSPQPLSMTLEIDGKTYTINDPTRKTLESRIDVYPGESRLLDVTFRIEGEAECYGWNNSSYFCTPKYKNSKWQLPKGNYLIDVTVYSAGEICRGVFRLNNDFESKDFRLEAASKDEQALVEKIRKEEMARGI